ncbi:MAG: endo alpha-1,4 polygalactosaminidase [Deltaproteobacteria bacterium]|uniref:Endo alpha-1,4 polygalactosaminidase n=1 Tax=Candidatus Zymogenus saltonus TaxID=2844893 RepID=A0A9D8KCZ6_9DELT|nr:endo alpha-1,4 polygalactosaminidase [Candidatus Zymogenus saltonus]
MKKYRVKTAVFSAVMTIAIVGHGSTTAGYKTPVPISIWLVKSWACQLQGLEYDGAVEKLASLEVDMLVVEPMSTLKEDDGFDAVGMVKRLMDSGSTNPNYRKLILAYVDIGQAEEWRTYFKDDWRPPARFRPGRPDFMVGIDPDGWSGNYPVAYWDKRWKEIVIYGVIYGERSVLKEVVDLGFDGIYMDWVKAYDDESVIKKARVEGRDPAAEMVKFIGEIREYSSKRNPDFLVVAQNGPYLIEEAKGYLDVIDAIAIEDLSFSGGGDTYWDDPESGDIKTPRGTCRWCRDDLARVLVKYLKAGRPVFTVDYCIRAENAREAREYSISRGFVPFVSRTPLDRLP